MILLFALIGGFVFYALVTYSPEQIAEVMEEQKQRGKYLEVLEEEQAKVLYVDAIIKDQVKSDEPERAAVNRFCRLLSGTEMKESGN